MPFRVASLGQLTIQRDGAAVTGAGAQPRRLALLALLARAPERGASRDKVAAMLWPDADEERGRRAVTQALYALRRELGSDEAISGTKELRLDSLLVTSDVADFDEAVAAGDWERAAGLYRGPFLDGFNLPGAPEFERWVEEERSALAHEYARVLERAAESAEQRGDTAGAVGWWRRLAAHDRFNARTALRLMRALAAAGDRTGAIRHASIYQSLVEQELDLPADPAVLALAAELRVAPPAVPAAAPMPPPKARADAPAAAGPAAAPEPPRASRSRWAPGPRALQLGALIVVGALGIAGLRALAARRPRLDSQRVVVAPFDNRTGDPRLDLVGAMAAEWVTQGLARTDLVQVVDARTMLASARDVELSGTPRYLRALAEETGAGVVVSGSYYIEGDTLRFHTQITEPRSGRVRQPVDLVMASAARPTDALEPLRERIMGALAVLLDRRLNNPSVTTSQPPTFEAYRHFLLGMQSFGDDYETEYAHFIRAAELDTSYAQAKLWAGITSANLRIYPRADSLLAMLEQSRDRLAPYDQANLEYFYRGFVQGNWPASHAGAQRMLQLAPEAGHARFAVGTTASMVNRPREALDALQGVDLERGWGKSWEPKLLTLITRAHHMLGQHEAELEWGRRMRRIDPGQGWLRLAEGRALAALGRMDELEQRLDEGLALPPSERSWQPYTPALFALLAARELAAHGHAEAAGRVAERAVAWELARPDSERDQPAERRALAAAFYGAGRWKEARAIHESLVADEGWSMEHFGMLGVIAAREGRPSAAAAMSDSLAAISGPYRFGNPSYLRARIAALSGQPDEAVRLIRQSLSEGLGRFHQIHAEPDFQGIRTSPAFVELIGSPT